MRKEILFCIDPSTTCTGWAVFTNGELHACGYAQPKKSLSWLERISAMQAECFQGVRLDPTHLVVEFPEVYSSGKASPSSLIKVGAALGAVAACYADSCDDITIYNPKEWKGSIGKAPMCNRVIGKLDHVERALFDAVCTVTDNEKDPWCDVADAIGLGMKKVGRL